jgi:predicted nucleic acid-binding protein
MKPKRIYLETSIISYLAARRSRDLVISAWQEITREFWDKHRSRYRLHTSELVVEECRMGDAEAVRSRLALLRGIPEIPVDSTARNLASALLAKGVLPPKAAIDALHIAVAAAGGMDYLLTWNCRHLNNPVIKPRVRSICIGGGYSCPEICTPFELTEGDKS